MQLQTPLFPDRFPIPLTLDIFTYLPIHQLRNIKLVSKTFHNILTDKETVATFLKRCYNLDFFELNIKEPLTQIAARNFPELKEIPFWGYYTDGGVLDNDPTNWIDKAFLRTSAPMVKLRKSRETKIGGILAEDYKNFVQAVLKISRIIWWNEQEQKKFYLRMDQVKLYPTFLMLNNTNELTDNPPPLINNEFKTHAKYLKQYRQNIKNLLTQRALNDQFNITIPVKSLKQIANIHEVNFARPLEKQGTHNPVQSFLITTKKLDINCKSLQEMWFNNDRKYLNLYIKQSNFNHENITNMDQLQAQNNYKYIIFKKNSEGLLLWVNLCKQKQVTIRIPPEERVWTAEIEVHILRGKGEFFDYQNQASLKFHYCSFKGITIDI